MITTRRTVAEQLQDNVDELTQTVAWRIVRDRIVRRVTDDSDKRATIRHYRMPSLLAQLAGPGGLAVGNVSRVPSGGSPAPISVAARKLLTSINDRTVEVVRDLEVGDARNHPALTTVEQVERCTCRPYAACQLKPVAVVKPRQLPDVLRHACQLIIAERDAALTVGWVTRTAMWRAHIVQTLGLDVDTVRRVRAPCPDCNATYVTVKRDGERVRVPALIVEWAEPMQAWTSDTHEYRGIRTVAKVQAITCDACGTSWHRGDALEGLADYYLLPVCDCVLPYAPCLLGETQAERHAEERAAQLRHAIGA